MRGWIYDQALLSLTRRYYQAVLGRLPDGAHLLDIGIGTAGALLENAELVKAKDLYVTGVDIDEDYIARARRKIAEEGIDDRVDVHLISIYDFEEDGFDAAYFSSSFMIMPDPVACLEHVMGLLNEGGRVYFTQTFEEERNPLIEKAKPLLKRVTTIEFGEVTYEKDFFATLEEAGLDVLEHVKLSHGRSRNARLVVGEPRT